MYKVVETDFNLQRHLIPFMMEVPFYAELSRHIQKRFTTDIPTACVAFDQKQDELVMWVNPYFVGGGTYTAKNNEQITEKGLSNSEIRGLLTHEFDHIVFGHLCGRVQTPHFPWNIACDLAINSGIEAQAGPEYQKQKMWLNKETRRLPEEGFIPGRRPVIDPAKFALLKPEQQQSVMEYCELVESLPKMKASEYYFAQIMNEKKKGRCGGMQPDAFEIQLTLDDHGGWSEDNQLSEEMKEYIQGKIKSVIEKAVRHADSIKDGWGNIPADIREDIRRAVSTVVNWKSVLKQFIGQLVRGAKTTSLKKINKRYPYIHPGKKNSYVAKLLIAIDESGSVDDNMLTTFFAELDQLTKRVSVTLLHFDCFCNQKDLYEWKKGTKPELKRLKSGGTNFDAPTELANKPENRGKWDGMLILTDGCAPAPIQSRIKRGWVLGKDCKLHFDSNELQIHLTDAEVKSGSWR